jgi:tetratricopeptide (TPR) repeat protein
MMIASMIRATGVLLILAGAGLYGAPPANEALLCAWNRARNPDVVIRHCTAAIESGGLPRAGLAAVFGSRCRAYDLKDDHARALADCERAIQLAPETALPACRRGLVRLHSGDLDGAMLDFEQAIVLDPNIALAYRGRGSVYVRRAAAPGCSASSAELYDRAIQAYGQALRLRPDAGTYHARAWSRMHRGYYDSAVTDLDEAIRLGSGATAYWDRGWCYISTFYYSRAMADFDQAIRLDPNLVVAYRSRAWLHSRRGDYDQAIRDYDQALRLRPNTETYYDRAAAYYHKGAYVSAFRDFLHASLRRFWIPLVLAAALVFLLLRRRKTKQAQSPAEDEELSVECPDFPGPIKDSIPKPEPSADSPADADLDVLIRTGMRDPTSICLMESLLQQAGIPFFVMDQNPAARQESGNICGWWNVRVPRDREAEAREILQAVEAMK